MPKIKNWSKEMDRMWENDKTGTIVSVSKLSSLMSKNWRTDAIKNPGSKEKTIMKKDFNKKERAMKYAVNWMRNHPRG